MACLVSLLEDGSHAGRRSLEGIPVFLLKLRLLLLWFSLAALLQVGLAQLAFAQKKGVELKAQQGPASQAGPPRARIRLVKRDPADPLKLFSATVQGLQVSDNGGRSWRALAVGGRNEEVFAFAVNPVNPHVLFVGHRDGLWKSQDGGKSWSSLPYPDSVPLSVGVAKSSPQTLYLATARRGVYKSVDGGYQWVDASNGLPAARAGGRPEEIHTLIVDPRASELVYAALSRHGIYRTTDGGASWHEFNQGLPFPMQRPTHPPRLAYDPDNPKRLYLAFNEPIHSRLVRTRIYALSDDEEWLPVEAELPSNFQVLSLTVDGIRGLLQLWGSDQLWEVSLPQK